MRSRSPPTIRGTVRVEPHDRDRDCGGRPGRRTGHAHAITPAESAPPSGRARDARPRPRLTRRGGDRATGGRRGAWRGTGRGGPQDRVPTVRQDPQHGTADAVRSASAACRRGAPRLVTMGDVPLYPARCSSSCCAAGRGRRRRRAAVRPPDAPPATAAWCARPTARRRHRRGDRCRRADARHRRGQRRHLLLRRRLAARQHGRRARLAVRRVLPDRPGRGRPRPVADAWRSWRRRGRS